MWRMWASLRGRKSGLRRAGRQSAKKSAFAVFLDDRVGTTSIEYALMAVVVGVGVIGGMSAFSKQVVAMFKLIATTYLTVGP